MKITLLFCLQVGNLEKVYHFEMPMEQMSRLSSKDVTNLHDSLLRESMVIQFLNLRTHVYATE